VQLREEFLHFYKNQISKSSIGKTNKLMKKIFTPLVIILSLAIVNLDPANAQNVAINTDGSVANASAILDIKSTNKGLLTPRLTQAQRDLINNPASGLLVYQIDNTPGFYFFDGSGWTKIATGIINNLWSANGASIYNNNTIQSVAVNTDGTIAHSSAILDITSTSKGLLTPRMTQAQRDLINNPAMGLMIFQTDNTPGYYFYNGSAWTQMATGSISNLWSVNGTNIYNNNIDFVGIGTNSPISKLTVRTANGYGFIHTDGNIEVGTYIGDGGTNVTGGWLGTRTNHPLMFFTNNGNPQMTILQNGNIGIGTMTPEAPLDVAKGATLNGTAYFRGTSKYSVFNYGGFEHTYITGGKNGSLVYLNDQMVVEDASLGGDVGIGTSNPTERLTVFTSDNKYGFTHTNGTVTVGSYIGGGAGWLGTKSNHPLYFFTNDGAAQMAIKTNGQVSVNGGASIYFAPAFTINNSDANLTSGLAIASNEVHWLIANNYFAGSPRRDLDFYLNGAPKAWIDDDGNWNTYSDINLKENISPYKSVLSNIKNLKVSTYRYKSNAPDSRSFGLIAQNVAQYFPEIVSETQDKDGNKLLGIAYGKTGVLALKAIQEQQVIIEKQQQQIDLLMKRIEALEKLIH
jgi:hypothetical protein